ncbi:MAG: GyrI-like domain-containing protein [Hungatella sp.]|jgi:AraC family transcriptional regulator|nr:GyrI-like domain-containing protein [Hungatella sp.]
MKEIKAHLKNFEGTNYEVGKKIGEWVLSQPNFHSYFYAIMEETIGSYIRGRRLTQAAWSLVHTEKKILDIAVSLYFESAESFARAFKKRYLITPSQYRKNGINVLIGNHQSAENKMFKLEDQCSLKAQIVNTIPKYIMGIRFKTDIDTSNIVEMWSIFNELVSRLGYDVCTCKRYSIFESTESCSVDKFNADSEATVFIGIEVYQNNDIPEEMLIKRLVANKYAKFTHTGTAGSLLKTYQYIWGVWFPNSGYEIAGHDDFECYTERFSGPDNPDSEIDIYFPIK